ncbi:MAG: hypothetical protein WDZ54_14685 [Sneathiella sp.]
MAAFSVLQMAASMMATPEITTLSRFFMAYIFPTILTMSRATITAPEVPLGQKPQFLLCGQLG